MTREILWVGIGGAGGAIARMLVATMVTERLGTLIPYATLLINVTGSFVLGLVVGAIEAQVVSPAVRPALAIGFLGAFTTFSTFSLETATLLEEGNLLLATVYVSASVVVGIVVAALGLWVGRALA
jgi:fluoride exporter